MIDFNRLNGCGALRWATTFLRLAPLVASASCAATPAMPRPPGQETSPVRVAASADEAPASRPLPPPEPEPVRPTSDDVLARIHERPVYLLMGDAEGKRCRAFTGGQFLVEREAPAGRSVRLSLMLGYAENAAFSINGWGLHASGENPETNAMAVSALGSCGRRPAVVERITESEVVFTDAVWYMDADACESAREAGRDLSLGAACTAIGEAYLRSPGEPSAAIARLVRRGGRVYWLERSRPRSDGGDSSPARCVPWTFEPRRQALVHRSRETNDERDVTRTSTYTVRFEHDVLELRGPRFETRAHRGEPVQSVLMTEASFHFVRQVDDDTVFVGPYEWHLSEDGCANAAASPRSRTP